MVDYHAVLDLLPTIARLFFENHLGVVPTGKEALSEDDVQGLSLSNVVQRSILLALGLQRKTVEDISVSLLSFFFFFQLAYIVHSCWQGELNPLPVSQVLALFIKSMRKVSTRLNDIQKSAIESSMPAIPIPMAAAGSMSRIGGEDGEWAPVTENLNDELNEAGDEVLREKQKEIIESLDLSK